MCIRDSLSGRKNWISSDKGKAEDEDKADDEDADEDESELPPHPVTNRASIGM